MARGKEAAMYFVSCHGFTAEVLPPGATSVTTVTSPKCFPLIATVAVTSMLPVLVTRTLKATEPSADAAVTSSSGELAVEFS